ncbi:MutS2 family protein [Alicyclobacillus hesperidum URH17-3-68]|nr:MutS2 family protein [Alicyclobacillus hesperidum URH17-3-68]
MRYMIIRSLEALEYDWVRQRVADEAMSSLGKQLAQTMSPFSFRAEAESALAKVDEAYRCLLRAGSPPFAGVTDIRPALSRAKVGGVLGADQVLAIAQFIAGGRAFRQFIEHAATEIDLPVLSELLAPMADLRRTEQEIRQVVSDDGQVLDHASDVLLQLRSERRRREGEVRTTLDRLLRTHQKLLQEPIVAMRGPYYCLPVRVEHKNQLRGIVRDVSSSGSTVFIEPRAVSEIGERIREIEVLEEREIERILQQISAVIATVSEELETNVALLEQADLIFAKAGYARRIGGKRPQLTDGVWRLHGARHPQLHPAGVPIDVELGADFRLLIITGPNTGGKTVTLKTVGLLTLMAMSGLFLPTRRESEIGFCRDVFVDIGDEQSIEQSLSTFSSHMKNIIQMLQQVDEKSLVLLDELGAGTDPAEGSALAIAILDRLTQVGARVMATTHYAELKGYAFHNSHAMNASMEFDLASLRPTYRLLMGVPGRSNALAIAQRLGLPDDILAAAREHVAETDVHVEELIGKLEAANREAERLRDEAARAWEDARAQMEQLDARETALDKELADVRERARNEAASIVEKAQQEAERIIRELRQMRHTTVKDHELVELRKGLEGLVPERKASPRRSGKVSPKLSVGQRVRVISLGQKGDVVEVAPDSKSALVQLGAMRMKVVVNDLEVLAEAVEPVAISHSKKRVGNKDVRMQLDVRGETVEDALMRIDKYLDDAVVAGLARIVIIHGKGTGALKTAIRRHLQGHPQVKTSEPAAQSEGGDGATVVSVRI